MSGKRKKTIFLVALVVSAAFLVLYERLVPDEPEAGQKPAREEGGVAEATKDARGPGGKKRPVNPTIKITYAFDVADKKRLVGYSDAVFVGRVVEQVGEKPLKSTIPDDPGMPRTQFSVEVEEVIKEEGDEKGVSRGESVTVSQAGGRDPRTGRRVVVVAAGATEPAADAIIMEKGGTYLFSTRYDEREGWQTVSAQPFGNIPLDELDPNREETTEEFRRAEKEQVDPLVEIGVSEADAKKKE